MLHIAWSPIYILPLPEGHRFPMQKYELIPEQLLYEGTIQHQQLFEPPLLEKEVALLTHTPGYWQQLMELSLSAKEMRKIGFPLSERLILRTRTIAMGTVKAALYAREYGAGMNVAGGTHHAFADHGEGFCILNDIAIAANYLLHQQICSRILIVDLDVHQGNGTASIFGEEPRVFTFSMHGDRNYPIHKEKSDLDVPLPDGINDSNYLRLLDNHLQPLFDQFQPEHVFYLSGVDVLETDKLGRLGLSLQGAKERDAMVLEACYQRKVPITISMGGGYSPRLATVVEAHCQTFRLAQSLYG